MILRQLIYKKYKHYLVGFNIPTFFLFIYLFSFFISNQIKATHLIGGTMTYKYLRDISPSIKRFKFSIQIYRDCSSRTPFDNTVYISMFNAQNNQYIRNISVNNPIISSINLALGNPCIIIPPKICIEKGVYQFEIDLTRPSDSSGYILAHQRCCRNNSAVNIPFNQGQTYYTQITQESFDSNNSSPHYILEPPLVMCSNKTIRFPSSAIDVDGDSLYFHFSTPFLGASRVRPSPSVASSPPFSKTPWLNGYKTNYQIPSNPAFTLNSSNGSIQGYPNNQGYYVFSIQTDEFRNGKFYSTINRDILVSVVNCLPKNSPIIDSQTIFCNGLSYTFNERLSGNINYLKWNFGDTTTTSDTSSLSKPSYTYPSAGVYKVKLVTNKGFSCEDFTEIKIRIDEKVTVNFPNPLPCKGKTIKLTNFSSHPNEQLWDFGVTSISSDTSINYTPSYTYSDTGRYLISLRVRPRHFCEKKQEIFTSVYDSIRAIIDPQTTFCNGLTYNFTNSNINSTRQLWDFGVSRTSSDISNGLNPVFTFPDTGEYLVSLTAMPGDVCQNTTSRKFLILKKTKANFNTPLLICSDKSITFRNFSTNASKYFWDFGNNSSSKTSSFSIKKNPVFTYTFPNIYKVNLIASDSRELCPDTIIKTITVNPGAIADFSFSKDQIDLLEPEVIIKDKTGYPKSSFLVYDTLIINKKKYELTYTDTGFYNITQYVKNKYGCKDTLTKRIYAKEDIIFWIPTIFTPNNDGINDEFGVFSKKNIGGFELKIYNRWGKLVFKSNNIFDKWNGQYMGKVADSDTYSWIVSYKEQQQILIKYGYLILVK